MTSNLVWTLPGGRRSRSRLRGALEDAQRPVIASSLANGLLEPLHGLDVVVEDVGPRDPITVRKGSSSPLKSGISTSMPMPGDLRRRARMVAAQMGAPPSARSSRSTLVMTKWSRPIWRRIRRRDAARPRPSSRPARLDREEPARTGADVAEDHDRRRAPAQHSPMLGHCGSRTPCAGASPRMMPRSSW